MRIRLLTLVIAAAAGVAHAQGVPDAPVAPLAVAMTTRDFDDPSRMSWTRAGAPRPLDTTIWYPAEPGTADTVVIGAPTRPLFIAGEAIHGGTLLARSTRFPLIVISHGTGGSAIQMMWLGHTLASHGYIVAAVTHHGNNEADAPTVQGFTLWWERARDLKVVIDSMLGDREFGPRIDVTRIGAAGFSLGGYTMMEIAGGRTDLAAYSRWCARTGPNPLCDAPPEFADLAKESAKLAGDAGIAASRARAGDSYRDPRVKAVFAIAPAMGGAFADSTLAAIRIPVAIVVGDRDDIAPASENAARFARAIPGATLETIHGARHYTFLDVCTPFGVSRLPAICTDDPGVDRAKVHASVAEMATRFFDSKLQPGATYQTTGEMK